MMMYFFITFTKKCAWKNEHYSQWNSVNFYCYPKHIFKKISGLFKFCLVGFFLLLILSGYCWWFDFIVDTKFPKNKLIFQDFTTSINIHEYIEWNIWKSNYDTMNDLFENIRWRWWGSSLPCTLDTLSTPAEM